MEITKTEELTMQEEKLGEYIDENAQSVQIENMKVQTKEQEDAFTEKEEGEVEENESEKLKILNKLKCHGNSSETQTQKDKKVKEKRKEKHKEKHKEKDEEKKAHESKKRKKREKKEKNKEKSSGCENEEGLDLKKKRGRSVSEESLEEDRKNKKHKIEEREKRTREKERERTKTQHKDKDRERDRDRKNDREREKERKRDSENRMKNRERERERERDGERDRDRDRIRDRDRYYNERRREHHQDLDGYRRTKYRDSDERREDWGKRDRERDRERERREESESSEDEESKLKRKELELTRMIKHDQRKSQLDPEYATKVKQQLTAIEQEMDLDEDEEISRMEELRKERRLKIIEKHNKHGGITGETREEEENESATPDVNLALNTLTPNTQLPHNQPEEIKTQPVQQNKNHNNQITTPDNPIHLNQQITNTDLPSLNSTDSIKKRQEYFKMLEREREKRHEGDGKDKEDEMKKEKPLSKTAMFDMFSDSPSAVDQLTSETITRGFIYNVEDNYDDPEGYYIIKIGEIIKNKYKVTSIAGKGVFATVVRAVDLSTEKHTGVAIKIIRSRDIYRASGEKERNILFKLKENDKNDKRHCLKLIESFDYRKHLCIVLELLDLNLRETLNKYGKNIGLSLDGVRLYAGQLFLALYYLKKNRIVHADLKPDNIMVSGDTVHIKLSDFGSALYQDECGITEYLVSRYYRAPEIILGCQYDTPVDTWSAAVTLFELYTGKVLFEGNRNNEMLKLIMKVKGKFSNKILKRGDFSSKHFNEANQFLNRQIDPVTKQEYIKPVSMPVQPKKDLMSMLKEGNVGKEDLKSLQNFKDFLEKALALDPNKRITPEEALGHPFIQISQYKTKTSTQTTTGSTQILHSNKTVKGKNVKRNQY